MRKTFILPSLEVKKFNRESILTDSANSNVTDAQNALNDKLNGAAAQSIKTVALGGIMGN